MIIDKKCKEVIINSLRKYHTEYNKRTIYNSIEAIKDNDFELIGNDLLIGIKNFSMPVRYYDFFYPVK